MYIDQVSKDDINYAHIISNLRCPHQIIINTKDYFIFYVPETDYYYAECDEKSGKEDEVINKMKELGFNYFCTTNQMISKSLPSKFSEPYYQYVYKGEEVKDSDSKLVLLKNDDLDFVKETYGKPEYVEEIQQKKKIWALYENNELIGYVMEHLDCTTGGLYTKPEFRRKGYGYLLLLEGFSKVKKFVRHSHVGIDNVASNKLHEKLKCIKADITIYWNWNK